MNKVFLIGRLTKDPEIRYVGVDNSSTAVVSFVLAVGKNLTKEKRLELEAQQKATADFPRVTVWGKQAENVGKYLKKGSQCAVEGRIETGSYQDKDTNATVYTTDVIAERVEFLGSNSQDQGGNNQYQQPNNQSQQQNNQNQSVPINNNDNFFNDDFTEIEDDGRIPF